MVRYYVLKTARNESECADGKGSWVITTSKDGHITSGECHISMALYPDPRSRGKANELWRDSAVLLNARAGRP